MLKERTRRSLPVLNSSCKQSRDPSGQQETRSGISIFEKLLRGGAIISCLSLFLTRKATASQAGLTHLQHPFPKGTRKTKQTTLIEGTYNRTVAICSGPIRNINSVSKSSSGKSLQFYSFHLPRYLLSSPPSTNPKRERAKSQCLLKAPVYQT